MPLPTICRRAAAQCGGRDGCFRSGDRADFEPGQRLAAIGPVGEDLHHGGGGGLTPDVVDHHVDIGGTGKLIEGADLVGAERGQGSKLGAVASGCDHVGGAEPLGHLDRHPPGVAGCPQDRHPLAGPEVDPPTQRHPRGHGGVHRRRHHDRVDGVRQDDAAVEVDHGPLGHRPEGRVVEDRVADVPFRVTDHGIDPRDERQLIGARVVEAAGLGAHPRMQPGGQDLDDDLALSRWRRDRGSPGSGVAGRNR